MQISNFYNKLSKILLSLILIITILTGNIGNNLVRADFAAPSDPPEQQAILDILINYDPDVYHILTTELSRNDDFMDWYRLTGSSTIIEMLDTTVHETFHSYTWQARGYYSELIYGGNGTDYLVDMNEMNQTMFPTSEMAQNIPLSLRTFRYDTYVSSSSDASSNVQGMFGLLNEFSAYYWGLHTMYSLIPYFESYADDYNLWIEYTNSLGNNMTAYSEFKYWMLRYMLYARDNRPDVYQQVLNNSSFCTAYAAMEQNFAELINANINGIDGLNSMLAYSGIMIKYTDSVLSCNKGYSWSSFDMNDYYILMSELNQPDYIAMDKELKGVANGNIVTTPTQTEDSLTAVKKANIGHFCERLYTAALNRNYDSAGKDYWTDQLIAGMSGADAARQFFFSPEFINSNLNNTEFINRLYRTFMGREADIAGLDYWKEQMKAGMSREVVFDGFINSPEWANVCQAYGIVSGGIASPSLTTSPNEAITDFASRLYSTCLGRLPDQAGLDYWATELANHTKTGSMAAYEFFFSPEFLDAHYYNKEYVTRLYRTFMGREPDGDGFNYWLGELGKGKSRADVFLGFAESPEFSALCKDAGILI